MGVCNCSMFCCMLLYVHSSIAIILMGKGELVALLNLSSWCLVMVEPLFLAVPRGCLQFVIVVFPDHTHLLFLLYYHFYSKVIAYYYHSITVLIPLFIFNPFMSYGGYHEGISKAMVEFDFSSVFITTELKWLLLSSGGQ